MANQSLSRSSVLAPNKYNSVLAGNVGFYNYAIGKYSTSTAVSRVAKHPDGGYVFTKGNNGKVATVRVTAAGTIVWQREFTPSGYYSIYGVTVDPSGNIYVGFVNDISPRSYEFCVAKYNSDGVQQWVKSYGDTNGNSLYGITSDTAGNVYIVGETYTTNSLCYVVKIDSSGAILWQKYVGSANMVPNAVTSDSSNNIYIYGYTTASYPKPTVIKMDSSGNKIWDTQVYNSSGQQAYGEAICLDSAGNIYISGYDAANAEQFVVKLNSSGVIQWQRNINAGSSGIGIVADSSNNVYVAMNTGYYKFNTSGTIQWQRNITGSNATSGIVIDGNALVAFPSTNNYFVKVATDGSGTGTYTMSDGTSVTYAETQNTILTRTNLTNATPGLSFSTATYSVNTLSYPDSASSRTFTVVGIG